MEELNPYIAFSDVSVCLVLILVVLLAAGQLGKADDRYINAQQSFERAVMALPISERPSKSDRNDPPGAQRWVFLDKELFQSNARLTPVGKLALGKFAELLRDNPGWKRVRIEGHALPSRPGEPDDWASSAAVAAATAELFQEKVSLDPWLIAVAGRGGQTPYCKVYLDGFKSAAGKRQAGKLWADHIRFSNRAIDGPAEVSVSMNMGPIQRAPDDLPAVFKRNLRVEMVVEFMSSDILPAS